jgi:hypothetical protein
MILIYVYRKNSIKLQFYLDKINELILNFILMYDYEIFFYNSFDF